MHFRTDEIARSVGLAGAVVLLAAALATRLHELGLGRPFDLDEGVYWESLRAMHDGAVLYRQIYFSQPPLFLVADYPVYLLFGQTIFAARLGIVLASLAGMFGAFLIGNSTSGRKGGIAAVALVVADAHYLAMSQTLQAEGPAIGFALLGVGLAFVAYKDVDLRRGSLLNAISGIALGAGILSKFLALPALAPIVTLFLMNWLQNRMNVAARRDVVVKATAWAGGIVAVGLFSLPHNRSDLQSLLTQVIFYHLSAAQAFQSPIGGNAAQISEIIFSPLGLAASIGVIAAIVKRDDNGLPLAVWLLATIAMLLKLVPLFGHHLVALVPPLVSLSVLTIANARDAKLSYNLAAVVGAAGLVVMTFTIVTGLFAQAKYYRQIRHREAYGSAQATDRRAVEDLRTNTRVGDQVVTDAQFLTALANRDTPPWLVDTTLVRVHSGQLTLEEIVRQSSAPRVRAVLFYGDRLAQLTAYHQWVARHFRLCRSYGQTNELWIRVPADKSGADCEPGRDLPGVRRRQPQEHTS